MKCHWSTVVLTAAFLIGTVLLQGVASRKQNPLQRSRRSHHNGACREISVENVSTVPFKVFSINVSDTVEDLVDFNYETLWQNGSHTSTRIPLLDLDFFSATNESQLDHVVEKAPIDDPENLSSARSADLNSFWNCFERPSLKRRLKRLIFGRDGRIRLNTSTQAQKFPFSTTVKISTGCSGSLISHSHVLTSAHCLHDGTQPLTPIVKLKVGYLRRSGKLRWIGVENIKFPEKWRLRTSSPSFDYAVITLQRAIKRPFFKLGVIKASTHLYKLHFASFPGDKKPNSLWYSHCFSRVISSLLIGRCDASTGSSGAGTYVRTSLKEPGKHRVVVGVLSGSSRVRLPDGRNKLFNLVTKLTNLKAKQICRWIGAGSDCISWTSKSIVVQERLRSGQE